MDVSTIPPQQWRCLLCLCEDLGSPSPVRVSVHLQVSIIQLLISNIQNLQHPTEPELSPSPGLFLIFRISYMYPLQFAFCSISMQALHAVFSCCFCGFFFPPLLRSYLEYCGFFFFKRGFSLIYSNIGPMASLGGIYTWTQYNIYLLSWFPTTHNLTSFFLISLEYFTNLMRHSLFSVA